MTISSPVAATSSSIARHFALNSLADTVRLDMTIVILPESYSVGGLSPSDRPGVIAGDRAANHLQVEQRALAPRGRHGDPEQLDHPVGVQLTHLREGHALQLL